MSGWDGLLLIDKPSGPTSHDIVSRVRRISGERRVGHGGTLDPLASGLLPLVLGRATRLVRFLPHSPKAYTGALRLGAESTTDDAQGDVRLVADPVTVEPRLVRAVAAGFLGTQLQVPPAVSARKVGGQRLYRLARRGVAVQAPPAQVHVSRFDLVPTADPAAYAFLAEVSGGTYIRALVRDLGQRLGCGALLTELRRTRIGALDVDQAVEIGGKQDLAAEVLHRRLIPPGEMPLAPPPARLVQDSDTQRFQSGRTVDAAPGVEEGDWCCVLSPTGRFLGLARRVGGRLQPKVVIDPQ